MKKITTFLFSLATVFSFTQCSNNSGNEISTADARAKVITELMDNDAYMKEVMVAMKAKHGDFVTSTSCEMMKEDKAIGNKMMNNMMEMCDMDESQCSMMMGSMKEHPKAMKSMIDMGMCKMK